MGKCMRRKLKNTEELSLIEGVLTRAKTLALQKAAAAVSSAGAGAGSYIQLRSRRLVKPNSTKKLKEGFSPTNPRKTVNSSDSVKKLGICEEIDEEEGSFGENMVEIEGRERSTRETTPCDLIRNPDAIRTPGSSTKPTRSGDGKYMLQNRTTPRPVPSTREMDEFFTGSEKQQQRMFIEKYNFDPVKEKPLRGRYEWVKINGNKKS